MTDTDSAVQHPALRQLLADAEATLASFDQLFDELPSEQLVQKPSPDAWSITECIDHLYTTGKAYYPRIEAAVQHAEQAGDTSMAPLRPTLFARLFFRFVEPERKRKVKTMPLFQPSQAEIGPGILDAFREQQQILYDLIRRADGLDLNGRKFASPASRLVRFTLGEGLQMIVMHQQRHLNQALSLK